MMAPGKLGSKLNRFSSKSIENTMLVIALPLDLKETGTSMALFGWAGICVGIDSIGPALAAARTSLDGLKKISRVVIKNNDPRRRMLILFECDRMCFLG